MLRVGSRQLPMVMLEIFLIKCAVYLHEYRQRQYGCSEPYFGEVDMLGHLTDGEMDLEQCSVQTHTRTRSNVLVVMMEE